MQDKYKFVMKFLNKSSNDHVGAYAAQSAYFWILSLMPLFLMLLTLVQYTPLTKADIMLAIETIVPSGGNQNTSVDLWLISLVNEVYDQSTMVVPVTAIAAFWSAGRGVLAITTGLNTTYGIKETRNYVFIRIRAGFYTLLFVLAILFSLLLLVFGNDINAIVSNHFPLFKHVTDVLMGIRITFSTVILVFFFVLIYRYLPNHDNELFHARFKKLLPGAIFTSVGWLVLSFIFSYYVEIFKGFTNMYGSLATLILLMLWLYFIMYVLLMGGVLNALLEQEREEKRAESPEETKKAP